MNRDCPHGVQFTKRMHLCPHCMEPEIERLEAALREALQRFEWLSGNWHDIDVMKSWDPVSCIEAGKMEIAAALEPIRMTEPRSGCEWCSCGDAKCAGDPVCDHCHGDQRMYRPISANESGK